MHMFACQTNVCEISAARDIMIKYAIDTMAVDETAIMRLRLTPKHYTQPAVKRLKV